MHVQSVCNHESTQTDVAQLYMYMYVPLASYPTARVQVHEYAPHDITSREMHPRKELGRHTT